MSHIGIENVNEFYTHHYLTAMLVMASRVMKYSTQRTLAHN